MGFSPGSLWAWGEKPCSRGENDGGMVMVEEWFDKGRICWFIPYFKYGIMGSSYELAFGWR
jgi:hypothetical protein